MSGGTLAFAFLPEGFRQVAPERGAEIYAMPATSHVRQRRARRRTAAGLPSPASASSAGAG